MVTYQQIENDFNRLRDYVLDDLDRILALPKGGNYAVAQLIVCACDALTQLQQGRRDAGEETFRLMLPELWRPVVHSLYDALRNGLVHSYDPRTLMIDGRALELGISWRDQAHLTFSDDHTVLFLNLPALVDSLRAVFEGYEAELRQSPEQRDRFYKQHRKAREHAVTSPAEVEAWLALLGSVT